MGYTTLWKRLSPAQLNFAIQAFSLIAIFFEGYDQGVMGGVNATSSYLRTVGLQANAQGNVIDTTHQGGIVSIVSLFQTQDVHVLHVLTKIIVLPWSHCRLLRRWLDR